MINLSNKESINLAIANFKSLTTHPGWIMLEEIVGENIKVLEAQILEGIPNETLDDIKRLRDKLSVHKDIINTPSLMIDRLENKNNQEIPNDDPFENIEETTKK